MAAVDSVCIWQTNIAKNTQAKRKRANTYSFIVSIPFFGSLSNNERTRLAGGASKRAPPPAVCLYTDGRASTANTPGQSSPSENNPKVMIRTVFIRFFNDQTSKIRCYFILPLKCSWLVPVKPRVVISSTSHDSWIKTAKNRSSELMSSKRASFQQKWLRTIPSTHPLILRCML